MEIDLQREIISRAKLAKYLAHDDLDENTKNAVNRKISKLQNKVNTSLRCVVLDFSGLSYIDPSGAQMLKGIVESFQKLDILLYISGSSGRFRYSLVFFYCFWLFSDKVYEMLRKCGLIEAKTSTVRVFSTVHDAVLCAAEIITIPAYTINTISRL